MATSVVIDEEAQTVTTTFDDGAQLVARPSLDAESVARAQALGYRGSPAEVTWAMTRDHDVLHTILAEAKGHVGSVALWTAAHPREPVTSRMRQNADAEERTVLLMQRLLNVGVAPLLAERE